MAAANDGGIAHRQHHVSLRQELAKVYGTKHFQIASGAMASLPTSPLSSSPSASTAGSSNLSRPTLPTAASSVPSTSASHAPQLTSRGRPRGRSPTRRHLWAWSPEKVRAELHEEDLCYRQARALAQQQAQQQQNSFHVDPRTESTQIRSIATVHGTVEPSSRNQAQPHFEAPPESTSLVPILGRPPPNISVPTVLELQAFQAEENHAAGEFSYLVPRSKTPRSSQDEAESVLYTRSHLPELDLESRHLWHALHDFRAVTRDYGYAAAAPSSTAVAPHPLPVGVAADVTACPVFQDSPEQAQAKAWSIERIFNWSSLQLPEHVEKHWYGVAFRSIRKTGSESLDLYEADRRSHEEAVSSGGLILYWYGLPSATTRENLATCIWTSREDAVKASSLPEHSKAATHSAPAYEKYELSRYKVVKRRGETGLRIEPWSL